MFGLNMWVRPFGHPSVPGGTDPQSSVSAPHLAALPYSAAAPWMFLAQRASNAAAAASFHGKGAQTGSHPSWPATTGTDAASLANTDKLLELHRKLMAPHHQAYGSAMTPTDLRIAADKYSSAFRPSVNGGHSDPEPGECGTSGGSMTGYYPSAFIPPKRPRIDSKGSVSPARSSSDRDSSTPSGDARSKSCSPRGSVGSRCSPLPPDATSEDRGQGQSPHSIHQPWLSPASLNDRRCFRSENGHTICPVCEVELNSGEVAEHYAKEMDKLYSDAAYAIEQQRKQMTAISNKENKSGHSMTGSSVPEMSHIGSVRYQTYLKIRQNRHDRLRSKCRGRRRRHQDDQGHCDHDDKHSTHNRSLDSSFDEQNQSILTSGSGSSNNDTGGEITVDVDSLDDSDPNAAVPLKCSICLSCYSKPVTSTQCWHVFCENCWLKALNDKRLCPHCQAITSPSDLRKVTV